MNPRIYRIAPEYRRCAIYVMVGFSLMAAMVPVMGPLVMERALIDCAVPSCILLAISLAMIIPLRWALRVDETGIARRFLFRWDFWSWGDLASGRITKCHPMTFVDPARPWWRRRLSFTAIEGEGTKGGELECLIHLINEHYRMPPSPEPPDTLRIRYGPPGFRRTAELDLHGIGLVVRGETHTFTWKEVQRLHIARMDSLRRDFARLELALPGHEIALKKGKPDETASRWDGDAVVLTEFLLAHVPPDRIDIDIAGQRPARAVDVQKQLTVIRKNERFFRIWLVVSAMSLGAWLIGDVFVLGMLHALFMTGMMLVFVCLPCGLIIWFGRPLIHEKTKQLETWLAEFENEASPMGHPQGELPKPIDVE